MQIIILSVAKKVSNLVQLQQLMVTKTGFGKEKKKKRVPLLRHRKRNIANAADFSSNICPEY